MRGKKIIRTIAVSLLFMIAACVALAVEPERGIAAAQAEAARQPGQRAKRNHKPGELLVKFKAGVRANSAGAVMRAKGPSITESRQFKDLKHKRKKLKHPEAKLDRWWHVKLAEGEDLERAMAEIAADPSVDLVELNYEVHVQLTPNDPRFNELWGMHNIQQNGGLYDADIDAPEAWDLHTGDQSIVVAVIDTGVDYGHEDLADNMWINPGEIPGNGIDDDGNGYVDDIHGYDFINNDADPFDDFGHGTHCAGTIAGVGNNGIGVAGVNWNAGIMAVKFIGSGGSGPISGAIDAITYAINNGAKIMSNSWGGRGFSQAMLDAVNAANDAGILFVAAAGNSRGDNDINPIYPASYNAPNIVTVAATDYNDNKATFSCYGAQSVHLGAPGVNILSTVPTGACTMCSLSGYTRANGTSMATPHVAGAAALILARNPAQSVADLKTTLLSGVDPIPSMEGITITGGRLNIGTALAFNLEFEVAVSPASQSVLPGGAATYDVTVNSNSDLEQQVTLTPGALDPGISATLADGVLTLSAGGTATTTLTVTADSSVPRGNYAVIIDAIDGNGETISSAATSLRVLYPTYSVGVTPSLNVVAGGDGATYDIVLTAIDGYNGAVSLSTTSPDPLISLAISPTDAMLPVDGAVAATLTATTDPTTPTQTYTFTVMATDALESKTINAQIQILNTDLVMTSVTHSVSEIDVGENFTINSTIANLGTGATATQTKVSYHLSTDATITSDDTLIGSENVAAVSGNGSVDLNGTVWVPFSLQEGTYYVGAIADDTNRQPETNEINNALAATNTIQVTRNIDLVPTALHVPSGNISTGSHFTVTSAIANQGTSNPTGYFSVGYYLSTDAQITAADTKIADRRVYSLRAGAGLNLSDTVYIPAGMAPGTYYLGVLVDENDSQAEANESNNGLAAAGTRQVISDIDLVPTALHVPPGNISTGSHFTVTSTIANQGTSNPTGYFSVGYYLSTDAQITAADTKIADRRVYSLRAGAGLNLSDTVYIPAGMAPGTYYLGVLVDKNDSQAEANESNNGLAAAGTRQVISDIDLVPTALHVPPGNISTGSHFTVTSSIANQGTSNPTGYFFVGYYLSTDAQITAADTKIADRRVYSLRAGAGLNLSATVYIPAGMAPGTYYLGVLVDKNDSQAEANEGNNGLAAAGARQVISDIDLVPTALHVPPGNISTGSHFTVTSTIANQGTSNPTGYFSVGYYLSTDAQITAADTKIADRRISSLRAGAGLNLSATVYIPARMAPGIYYLGVLVDENDSQAEADEGNNGLAAAGARQVISDIDLVPTALHVPPGNISTGSHFTVTSSIANQGTSNPTGYFSVGYYLSTDAQITAADTKIADRRISSLRAGAGLNLSATVYIPAGMAPGTYYLGVLVDENDSQAEADESNNALGTQVNVVQ